MNNPNKFGTFGGVFTPNFLTIIGIILFLRLGWVVGNAGLTNAIIIIFLANCITFITGLSLSAVATNIKVKTGGPYFIISRSFGLEIGGSIGLTLYFSQTISVALYLLGFAEAVKSIYPIVEIQNIAFITLIIFAVIAWIGAGAAIKVQYIILIVILSSLFSFFSGGTLLKPLSKLNYAAAYSNGYDFWKIFAVFFPAVTGIMAGASMSGDLESPEKSIPRGTISAIIITFFIYIFCSFWFSFNSTTNELISDNFVMYKISKYPKLIAAGVISATLSSALASIVAAPRILQALSNDKIISRFFSLTLGSKTEPRLGILITAVIAGFFIYLGNINVVASVITMFFLNTYGMTNFTAAFESIIGNPNYRPTLKIHWFFSIVGAFACYGVMFLINFYATLIAIILSYGIYVLLKKKSISKTWGDLREGIWFSLSRFTLMQLERAVTHKKNWKPNIMIFTGNPKKRDYLIKIATWFGKGKGFFTLVNVLPTEKNHQIEFAKKSLDKTILKNRISAFSEIFITDYFFEDIINFVKIYGIGKLKPNSLLFGLSDKLGSQTKILKLVPEFVEMNKNVFLLYVSEKLVPDRNKTIDIWWRGLKGNGSLMLLTAYLLTLNDLWKNIKIRILTIIDSENAKEYAKENIINLLKPFRIKNEVKIIYQAENKIDDIIIKNSENSNLCFLGIPDITKDNLNDFCIKINHLTHSLENLLLIKSCSSENILSD